MGKQYYERPKVAKRYHSGGNAFNIGQTSGPSLMPTEIISAEVSPSPSSNLKGQYPDSFKEVTAQISSDASKIVSGFKLGKM